jgi:YegS/Rv2252/BmrU family lipid kinase
VPPRRLRLIVNPHAGGGRALAGLPAVEQALRGHGVEFTVHHTTGIEHAQALARGAVQAGEVAVSFGGDGLAGAIAHALRGTHGTLGLLPGGRGNDFARKVGIPLDLPGACLVLALGIERTVDVAEVDGRTFLGIASFGIDTEVQDIANATTSLKGQAVYLYATLRALAAWKPVPLVVAVDGGEPRRFEGYSVAACNSGVYGGGMHLAPDAEITDGLLDVVSYGDLPRWRFLRGLARVFRGTHLRDPAVELVQAREVRVDAGRTFRIYADGDPIGTTPATIRAVPRGLRILAP